ncbi:unnamed protein product [Moneuplotes crassus]|uniref:Uncharacterized protein n=1 Tax=Euplotes crassus TaxID=5936 RepID=A0AAD1UHF8_EUPCR|nr:unnamed protein product [Moneuplotes crassus]
MSENIPEKPLEKTKIFTERIPILGEVSLMFYVPYCFPHRQELIKLIYQNGGAVVPYASCGSFQIAPESILDFREDPQLEQHYFNGRVYSHRLLIDSINSGKFPLQTEEDSRNPNDYVVAMLKGARQVYKIDERRRYTITEIVKMGKIMEFERPFGKKIWTYSEVINAIPERPVEGMRSTFKKYTKLIFKNAGYYEKLSKRQRLDSFDYKMWTKRAIEDLLKFRAKYCDFWFEAIRPFDNSCPCTNLDSILKDDQMQNFMNLNPLKLDIKMEKMGIKNEDNYSARTMPADYPYLDLKEGRRVSWPKLDETLKGISNKGTGTDWDTDSISLGIKSEVGTLYSASTKKQTEKEIFDNCSEGVLLSQDSLDIFSSSSQHNQGSADPLISDSTFNYDSFDYDSQLPVCDLPDSPKKSPKRRRKRTRKPLFDPKNAKSGLKDEYYDILEFMSADETPRSSKGSQESRISIFS